MSNEPARRVALPSRHDEGLWVVVAVGVALAALGAYQTALGGMAPGGVRLGFELFTDVGLPLFAVGVVLYSRQSSDRSVGRVRGSTLARWTVAGIVALGLLAAWAAVDDLLAGNLVDAGGTLVLGANLGVLFGVVAGINRAQTRRNAELAERERAQREGLVFLNHLLRHHVLNGMTIIDGHADELREEGVDAEHVEVIERQSQRIVALVENVETLVGSLSGEVDPRPVEVDAVAERAVADARETYSEVAFDLETEAVTARADEFLRAVVDNLLSNAVEHNDREEPHVGVAVEGGESVMLRVEDDGPGVPEEVRESFAEKDDTMTAVAGDGLGLYLVHTLVTNYDGSVRIEDREPQGTVVTVELPPA